MRSEGVREGGRGGGGGGGGVYLESGRGSGYPTPIVRSICTLPTATPGVASCAKTSRPILPLIQRVRDYSTVILNSDQRPLGPQHQPPGFALLFFFPRGVRTGTAHWRFTAFTPLFFHSFHITVFFTAFTPLFFLQLSHHNGRLTGGSQLSHLSSSGPFDPAAVACPVTIHEPNRVFR